MNARRSFLTKAGVLAVGAAGAWWLRDQVVWPRPRAVFRDGAASSGWLPFEPAASTMVFIDIQANGRTVRALLDSGAQSTVVDKALAQRLGLSLSPIAPVMAFGVSGTPQIGRSARLGLDLGSLRFERIPAAVLDLTPIAAASGRSFSLVLGQDMLRTVIADIDFPARRVAFHDPAAHMRPSRAVGLPARTEGGELLTMVQIEGRSIEVALDTGASGALALSPEAARAAGLLDGRRITLAPSITFGGVSHDRAVRARSLRFADRTLEDVLVHIYTPPPGGRVPPGLLGVEALQPFRVLIDLAGGRLDLIPRAVGRDSAAPPRKASDSSVWSQRRMSSPFERRSSSRAQHGFGYEETDHDHAGTDPRRA